MGFLQCPSTTQGWSAGCFTITLTTHAIMHARTQTHTHKHTHTNMHTCTHMEGDICLASTVFVGVFLKRNFGQGCLRACVSVCISERECLPVCASDFCFIPLVTRGLVVYILKSLCPCDWALCRRYRLNCSAYCSQSWYDGESPCAGVSCKRTGLLSSRSRPQGTYNQNVIVFTVFSELKVLLQPNLV